ncbi:RNA polymerase sigma factor [uncultured Muribaculum sp.]|uniref:RNA polymerase sigma factor n=1 Tax=uncultured Muribaculum sp. TaxID=1918613 RepID=UPI002617C11C|nr:RNA polymerase sigma factor [uncultured Muribaculum sp.]
MLTKWEELRLVARCVSGDDRRAFEKLVVEYQQPLRRFLLNLTMGNASLTDDLAQDTFLKAYLGLRSWQGIARFKTWLFRIAINEYYAWLRRNRELLSDDSIQPSADERVDTAGEAEASLDVERCLKVLSPNERAAVLLFYLEDKPLKEISRIMDMPEGTIKSHLSRAKVKMARVR